MKKNEKVRVYTLQELAKEFGAGPQGINLGMITESGSPLTVRQARQNIKLFEKGRGGFFLDLGQPINIPRSITHKAQLASAQRFLYIPSGDFFRNLYSVYLENFPGLEEEIEGIDQTHNDCA